LLFHSLEYALLLATVFVAYFALARWGVLRLLVLLAASYLFYAWWSPYYLVLIIGSSVLDYLVGGALHRSSDERRRRALLLVSLVGNLGLLATFKYFNFFADSVHIALTHLGVPAGRLHLDVVIPVGISFYTFQSLSYTIDIYRRKLEPVDGPLPFLVFVAFFPQLVAGPIVRAAEFLPQLRLDPRLSAVQGGRGLFWIGVGLAKKVVIADLLAVNLVDRVFEMPARYTSAELLCGVYGYALQIYCDFSAYSDIAIGSALLLGLSLPQNFDAPYRAVNLRDFWRRWHISLSTWLRDYLYISLGGSRGGPWKTYRNLILTMLLGGLWHGAGWTFVAWGALHGVGLAATRAFQRAAGDWQPAAPTARRLIHLFLVAVTFHYVCLGWVFFRAPSFATAWDVLRGLGALSGGTANVSPLLWALLGAGALTHLVPDRWVERGRDLVVWLPAPAQALLLAATVVAVRLARTTEVVPFIYFQF
jgi:D-alanyl-lipoteichoic acid acyltransferase DltB (MBOAT superfamily)